MAGIPVERRQELPGQDARDDERQQTNGDARHDVVSSSSPQTVIDSLVNQLGIYPVELLTAPESRQKDLFLQAMPMTVTADQLIAATGLQYTPGGLDRHALEVIAEYQKKLYDDRTGVNRARTEKHATSRQLQESLPRSPQKATG